MKKKIETDSQLSLLPLSFNRVLFLITVLSLVMVLLLLITALSHLPSNKFISLILLLGSIIFLFILVLTLRLRKGLRMFFDNHKKEDQESQSNLIKFQALLDTVSGIAIIGYDAERNINYWNDASHKLYGFSKEKALGSKVENLIIPPDKTEDYLSLSNKLMEGDRTVLEEETVRIDAKGSEIAVLSRYLRNDLGDGRTAYYIIDLDIRKQNDTVKKLMMEKELSDNLFAGIDEIMYLADMETGEVLFVNDYVERIIKENSARDKFIKALADRKDPCAFSDSTDSTRILREKGNPVRWEKYDRNTDSYYMITDRIINWKENRKVKFTLMIDITAFKKMELALKSKQDILYSTLDCIGEGLIATDTQGRITFMNTVAEEITGWAWYNAKGTPVEKVLILLDDKENKPSQKSILQFVETNTSLGALDNPLVISKDGKRRVIDVIGSPILNDEERIIGDIIVFRDVTIKKRIEQERIKSQKLDSLSTLAAGVAYDFNNLLSSLFGYIEMAMVFHNSQEKVSQYLARALSIYEKATGLTDILIAFSRKTVPEKQTTSLAELIEETAQFVMNGSKSRYKLHCSPNLWLCDVDRKQIHQAFNNILINSVQAMPEGGTITIKAENIPCSLAPEWTGRTTNYVKVSISDEGMGIPEACLQKIFDPFYTTKHKGSGLGLAIASSIIDKHKGIIDIESASEKGTKIFVYLPASKTQDSEQLTDDVVTKSLSGKILIMDDDSLVTDTIQDVLNDLGCSVTVCSSGSKALLVYQEEYLKGEPFDVVIFDLTVPGELGGLETLQILREKYPDIMAIATSGYLENPVMADPQKFGFQAKISKPYVMDELIDSVESALLKSKKE